MFEGINFGWSIGLIQSFDGTNEINTFKDYGVKPRDLNHFAEIILGKKQIYRWKLFCAECYGPNNEMIMTRYLTLAILRKTIKDTELFEPVFLAIQTNYYYEPCRKPHSHTTSGFNFAQVSQLCPIHFHISHINNLSEITKPYNYSRSTTIQFSYFVSDSFGDNPIDDIGRFWLLT